MQLLTYCITSKVKLVLVRCHRRQFISNGGILFIIQTSSYVKINIKSKNGYKQQCKGQVSSNELFMLVPFPGTCLSKCIEYDLYSGMYK